MNDRTVHLEAEKHGDVWLFWALTPAAQAWLDDNVADPDSPDQNGLTINALCGCGCCHRAEIG